MSNLPVSLGTVSDFIPTGIVVPPIDYTSRDYASLVNDMLALIPSYLPEWTDRSPGDFGIVLLELFAYVGDILNFYTDRIANEAFISTAQQRQSVLNLASLLDYTPHGNVAATCQLQFTISSPSPTPVLIPQNTQVATTLSGNQSVVFETTQDLWIYGAGVSTIKTFTGTGFANQQYVLQDPTLGYPTYVYNGGGTNGLGGNQKVVVTPPGVAPGGGGDVQWSLATGNSFAGYGPAATAFTVVGSTPTTLNTIRFGNGTIGANPANGATITITYQPAVPGQYSALAPAMQGVSNLGEGIGVSNGSPSQQFTLFSTPVVDGTVVVYVDEGQGPIPWTYHPRIIDAFSTEGAFTLSTDANGVVTVSFGDNIAGRIPAPGAFITADYMIGGGVAGNVAANAVTNLQAGPSNILSVTNPQASVGGADAETTDHIRIHAPLSITAINRGVTLDDYAALILDIPSIAKAAAMSTAYNAVNIYIHPAGNFISDIPTLTNRVNALMPSITNSGMTGYMDDKKMVGVSIVILPPQYSNAFTGITTTGYVPVNITGTVNVLPQYHQSSVQSAVIAAIQNLFLFAVVDFGSRISLSSVYHACMTVPGVDYVNITAMYRQDTASSLGDIVTAPYEIPQIGLLTITPFGGVIY